MRIFLAFAPIAAIAAVEPFDIVDWGDQKLRPEANFVYLDDRLIFHPKVRLSTGHDSNYSESENAESEFFLGLAIGLTTVWLPAEDHRFTSEVVSEVSATHRPSGSQIPFYLAFQWEDQGEPWMQKAQYSASRNDSPGLVVTGRQAYRLEQQAEYAGTWVAAESSLGASLTATTTDYLQETIDFGEDELDHSEILSRVFWGWQRAEFSIIEANVAYRALLYSDDNPHPDGSAWSASASWTFPIAAVTKATASTSVTRWAFDGPYNHEITRDDSAKTTIDGGLEARWEHEEDTWVTAAISRNHVPGLGANLDTVHDIGIAGRLAIYEVWGLDAQCGYTVVTASSAAAGLETENRKGWRGGIGGELYFDRGWLWRLALNYNESRARLAEPYQRLIAMTQITIAY